MLKYGIIFALFACGDRVDDTGDLGECSTDTDCPQMDYVWVAACDGDVLQTPSGSGETTCVEGSCEADFQVVESDCTETSQVCGENDLGEAACVAP